MPRRGQRPADPNRKDRNALPEQRSNAVCAVFENYQFANWRLGCGTLKASGGDYGGGSENLIVSVSILER